MLILPHMRMHYLLTIVSCLLFTACQPDEPTPPNVLFILADDLGYHDLGINGSTYYETPNLDRLAQEGIRFTRYAAPRGPAS